MPSSHSHSTGERREDNFRGKKKEKMEMKKKKTNKINGWT